jgi:hypothetical protein
MAAAPLQCVDLSHRIAFFPILPMGTIGYLDRVMHSLWCFPSPRLSTWMRFRQRCTSESSRGPVHATARAGDRRFGTLSATQPMQKFHARPIHYGKRTLPVPLWGPDHRSTPPAYSELLGMLWLRALNRPGRARAGGGVLPLPPQRAEQAPRVRDVRRVCQAGSRRFWLLSTMHAHTKAPYKNRFT